MRKATGIVRKIDNLGRVVLPMELRRSLKIEAGDGIEIYNDGEAIVLEKYVPACIFCGGAEAIRYFRGKVVCGGCVEEVAQTLVQSVAL